MRRKVYFGDIDLKEFEIYSELERYDRYTQEMQGKVTGESMSKIPYGTVNANELKTISPYTTTNEEAALSSRLFSAKGLI